MKKLAVLMIVVIFAFVGCDNGSTDSGGANSNGNNNNNNSTSRSITWTATVNPGAPTPSIAIAFSADPGIFGTSSVNLTPGTGSATVVMVQGSGISQLLMLGSSSLKDGTVSIGFNVAGVSSEAQTVTLVGAPLNDVTAARRANLLLFNTDSIAHYFRSGNGIVLPIHS